MKKREKANTGLLLGAAAAIAGLWYLSTKTAAAATAPAVAQSGAASPAAATVASQLTNAFTLQPISISPLNINTTFGTGTPTVTGQGAVGSAAAGAQANQVVNAQYELPATAATTTGLNSQAAALWKTFTPIQPLSSGYIDFPSGAQAAAADFSSGLTAMDAAGTYYVLWGTDVYQLGSQDANGNWPATLVAGG